MLYKKIAITLIAFFVIGMGSFYLLINAEMEAWMRIGASLFFGAVAALVGWVVAGE